MSVGRARDAQFGGEKTQEFPQGFPEVFFMWKLGETTGRQMLAHQEKNHLIGIDL